MKGAFCTVANIVCPNLLVVLVSTNSVRDPQLALTWSSKPISKHALFGNRGSCRTTNTSLRWIIILMSEPANRTHHKLQSRKLDTNADGQPYRYLVRLWELVMIQQMQLPVRQEDQLS